MTAFVRRQARRTVVLLPVLYIFIAWAEPARGQTVLPQIDVYAPSQPRPRAQPRKSERKPVKSAATAPKSDSEPQNGTSAPSATTAGPVSGYRALTAVSATRTDVPIERIPQTIAVVPRSVVDDQTPLTQSEALRNVAATTGVPANFLYGVNYRVRGFDAERYIDGLPNYLDAGDYTSLVNTERIEVVKGPGALLFQSGGGITGGVINSISKLPGANPAYQAGLIAGGYGLWNPWIDVNQPLGSGALFRFTGDFETAGDYVDVIERRRYSLNPTFTFIDNDGTSLTIQGRISRRDQQFYVGLPVTGTIDRSLFTLRPDLFVGTPNVPRSLSENSGVTVRLDHAFDSIWSFNVSARYAEMRQLSLAQSSVYPVPDFGTSFAMFNVSIPQNAREISVNPNGIAKFTVGETQNTLLLGADYDRVADDVSIWSSFAGVTNFANPFPVFPQYMDPLGSGTLLFGANNVNINGGLTAQLQTTAWDRLHLLSGVREAFVDFLGSHPFGGGQYHIETAKLLPRFGAAFDLLPGVTPFAGYSEGLRTVPFFGGLGTPRPEEAKQLEAGAKLVLPHGLAATLAVFDITRRNVVSTDPANPFLQVQAGEERSRGFDLTGTLQPLPGLSLLASYAHVDARVAQDAFFAVGNRLDRVPADSGRFWANYKVPDGPFRNVTMGAGIYAASSQATALDNRFFVPGFVTFDAKLAYEGEGWSLAMVGKNLSNRHYFVPYPFEVGRVAPGEPLTVLAVASMRQ